MVQHETWRLLDPSHPRHDPAEAAAHREQILDFHRKVDADVGRLLAEVGDDTLVVVMSDHGFGPVHSFFLTNNWLASLGLLKFKREPVDGVQAAAVPAGLYAAAHVPHRQGAGPGQAAPARSASSRRRGWSTACSCPSTTWIGREPGRSASAALGRCTSTGVGARPQGIVQPGAEYEELKDEIERAGAGPARSAQRRAAGGARLPPRRDLQRPLPGPHARPDRPAPGLGVHGLWPRRLWLQQAGGADHGPVGPPPARMAC